MSRNRKHNRSRTRQSNPPALIAWHVAERDEKSYWTRVGAAWDHEDAKGLTLDLDLIPVGGGRIILREPRAGDENEQPDS